MLQEASPSEMGFRPDRLRVAEDVVQRFVAAGKIPGAVAAVVKNGRLVLHKAWGLAAAYPTERKMYLETKFDLASLSKPVATTTVLLRLVESGLISLDQPVQEILPELSGSGKQAISFRHLLTHTSGLPGWRPTFLNAKGMDAAAGYIGGLPLAYPTGTEVQYSDLGFMLLGIAIVRLTGRPLDEVARDLVFSPCHMNQTTYGPASGDVAATEDSNQYERQMIARVNQSFGGWRCGVICGEVQDGNAYHTLDGISGNAGVFSTALDLAQFADMLLQGGSVEGEQVLSPVTVATMFEDHTPGLHIRRGLGWHLHGAGAPDPVEWQVPASSHPYFPTEAYSDRVIPRPGGELLPPGSPGHTGFTGTSLWLDRTRRLAIVLLTNRVHPVVRPYISDLRPAFHNAVMASLV